MSSIRDLTRKWSDAMNEWADHKQSEDGYLGEPPTAIVAEWLEDGSLVVWARGEVAERLHDRLAERPKVAYPRGRHRAHLPAVRGDRA